MNFSPCASIFFLCEVSGAAIPHKDLCSSYDAVAFAGSLSGGTRSQGHLWNLVSSIDISFESWFLNSKIQSYCQAHLGNVGTFGSQTLGINDYIDDRWIPVAENLVFWLLVP